MDHCHKLGFLKADIDIEFGVYSCFQGPIPLKGGVRKQDWGEQEVRLWCWTKKISPGFTLLVSCPMSPGLYACSLLSYLMWAALGRVAFCSWGSHWSCRQLNPLPAAGQWVPPCRGAGHASVCLPWSILCITWKLFPIYSPFVLNVCSKASYLKAQNWFIL